MTRTFAAYTCLQTDFPSSRLRTSASGHGGDIASDNVSTPQSKSPRNVAAEPSLAFESESTSPADVQVSELSPQWTVAACCECPPIASVLSC
jgi:hypothetical protein